MHLLLAVLVAAAAPVPSPATGSASAAVTVAVPTPDVPAAITARAKDWFHRLQTGDVDRSQLTPAVSRDLTPALLAKVSASLAPLGAPTAFEPYRKTKANGSTVYVYSMTFENGDTFGFVFALDDATGKISGLRVIRPQP